MRAELLFVIIVPILHLIVFPLISYYFIYQGKDIPDFVEEILEAPCNISGISPWDIYYQTYYNCTKINKELKVAEKINQFHHNDTDLIYHTQQLIIKLNYTYHENFNSTLAKQNDLKKSCLIHYTEDTVFPELSIYFGILSVLLSFAVIFVVDKQLWKHFSTTFVELSPNWTQILGVFIFGYHIVMAIFIFLICNVIFDRIGFKLSFDIENILLKC